MSEEKSYGEIACNAYWEDENWHLRDKYTQDEWHTAANAVIEEYKRRTSGEPVAWVDRKFGGSCVGWHQTILPPDGTELYTASPPPKLPSAEEIVDAIYEAADLRANDIPIAVEVVSKLLKKGK